MKKEVTISQLLGIKQQDAAMLLGVSQSQWSMYSSGKRDLPAHATALLADLLAHIHVAEANRKKLPAALNETRPHFERMLRENEYKQMQLARQIAASTKKQLELSRLLLLTDFLEKGGARKQDVSGTLQILKGKLFKVSNTTISIELAKQQHRQEMLAYERKMLEAKLEQHNITTKLS